MLTRAKLQVISDKIEAQLKMIEADLGVKLQMAGGRFVDSNATLKIKVSEIGDDGVALTQDVVDWNNHAEYMGFDKADLHKTFVDNGTQWMISGLAITRPKYPVSVTRVKDGKKFKMKVSTVLRALGREVI